MATIQQRRELERQLLGFHLDSMSSDTDAEDVVAARNVKSKRNSNAGVTIGDKNKQHGSFAHQNSSRITRTLSHDTFSERHAGSDLHENLSHRFESNQTTKFLQQRTGVDSCRQTQTNACSQFFPPKQTGNALKNILTLLAP